MYTVFDDIEQAFVRLVRRFDTPRQLAPVEIAILHPQRTDGRLLDYESSSGETAAV